MNFEFSLMNKGSWGSTELPQGIIRINKKSMSLAEDVTRRFLPNAETTKTGKRIPLAIEWDARNQAIRLTSADNGYSFHITDGSDYASYTSVPAAMKRAGVPIGDYKLVENSTNIFQLAR